MATSNSPAVAACICAVLLPVLAVLTTGTGLARQEPQYRTSTTLVPVDVRVLDDQGRPITDLTQADFTILEDGIPQAISHFASHGLVPTVPDPGSLRRRRVTGEPDVSPQNRRVFLILLGRGKLQPPARGVDGVLHLLSDLLMPQDQVAVFAWNRATDFTTDHQALATLVERFGTDHEEIEALLRLNFGGLKGAFGNAEIPAGIQRRIDAVFDGPEEVGVRGLPPVDVPATGRSADDERRVTDLLLGTSTLDVMGAAEAETLGVSFDEFVDVATVTNQNLANLYTALEYLKYIEGEKHLIFVAENLLSFGRAEHADRLAMIAAHARVAIHGIQTGGLPPSAAGAMTEGRLSHRSAAPFLGLYAKDQRAITETTGGSSSAFGSAIEAVERIAEATSFSYVLGYYPANQEWDGDSRRIEVRVNREGATLQYRRRFFAATDIPDLELREFAAYSRITSAGKYGRGIPDIPIEATAVFEDGDELAVTVESIIDASTLALEADEFGFLLGKLKFVVFAGDLNENVVGESWEDIGLDLSADTHARLLADGLTHQVRVPVERQPSYVKVVVYDYGAERVGSIMIAVSR